VRVVTASGAVTTTLTSVPPIESGTGADAVPDVTDEPFTVITAPAALAVGVTRTVASIVGPVA